MKVRKLRERTSKGVKIGDNESQIVARLGRPHKIERGGSVMVFRYGSNTDRSGYDEAYTFRAGRLIEIQFSSAAKSEEDEE